MERKLFIPEHYRKAISNSSFHRAGIHYLLTNIEKHLSNSEGTYFEPFIEWPCCHMQGILVDKWIGICHTTINPIPHKSASWCLDYLLTHRWEPLDYNCAGVFILSENVAKFVRTKIRQPVNAIPYPTVTPDIKFDWDKFVANANRQIVCIGMEFRNWSEFQALSPKKLQKALLVGTLANYKELGLDGIPQIPRLNNEEYDKLLAENVVHLPLYDVHASTVVPECIVRNTPVLLNRLPGNVEKLGLTYPLYYNTIEEANRKVNSMSAIYEAHCYLKEMSKEKFGLDYCLKSIVESEVYRKL